MTTDKLTYCGELVRRHDSDRFFLTLMIPPSQRTALWALFAFNYEIAKTREVVSETTIGLIRLQWWRDALAKIYDENVILQNEVLPELYRAIKGYDLPRDLFEALIYAREFDLENVAPGSLEGLEHYADFTNTPLLKLALKIVRQDESEEQVKAVATAYGLTGVLRAAPFHKAQGRDYMPADLTDTKDRTEITRTVADCAGGHLQIKPEGRFLKAMHFMTGAYLKQIKTLRYDVFDGRMAVKPPFFHLRLLLRRFI